MLVEVYALRRRPRKERVALALVRGGGMFGTRPAQRAGDGDYQVIKSAETVFANLRSLARRNGLVIRQPGVQFVDEDELLLLGWIAQAQRLVGLGSQAHPDERLRKVIANCGKILDGAGLRLPLQGTALAPFRSIDIIAVRARGATPTRRTRLLENSGQFGLFRSGDEAERG